MKTQNRSFPEYGKMQRLKSSGLCRSSVPRTKNHLRNYAVCNSNPFFIEKRFDSSDMLIKPLHFLDLYQRISQEKSGRNHVDWVQKL